MVDLAALAQGAAAVAGLTAAFALPAYAQGVGGGLAQAVARWWAAGILAALVEVCLQQLQLLLQVLLAYRQELHLLPQR